MSTVNCLNCGDTGETFNELGELPCNSCVTPPPTSVEKVVNIVRVKVGDVVDMGSDYWDVVESDDRLVMNLITDQQRIQKYDDAELDEARALDVQMKEYSQGGF